MILLLAEFEVSLCFLELLGDSVLLELLELEDRLGDLLLGLLALRNDLSDDALIVLELRELLIEIGLLLLDGEDLVDSDEEVVVELSVLEDFEGPTHGLSRLVDLELNGDFELLLAVAFQVEDLEELVLEDTDLLLDVLVVGTVARTTKTELVDVVQLLRGIGQVVVALEAKGLFVGNYLRDFRPKALQAVFQLYEVLPDMHLLRVVLLVDARLQLRVLLLEGLHERLAFLQHLVHLLDFSLYRRDFVVQLLARLQHLVHRLKAFVVGAYIVNLPKTHHCLQLHLDFLSQLRELALKQLLLVV